jgi:hypothetical protein
MGCAASTFAKDSMTAIKTILDFNRASLSVEPLNVRLNELIEQAEPPSQNGRQYLGASAIGSECLRKVQYSLLCDSRFPARIKDIFARGHFFEARTRDHLIAAGFKFAPPDELAFSAAEGLFRGHADGVIVAGPSVPTLRYPCLWECKCLNAKGWKAIERDGLVGLYAVYAAQVVLYQAYLDVTNPALFTVVNADSVERLHFLVPFDVTLAQEMSDRAVVIIEATRAGKLLARITEDPEDWRCAMCQWRERCWQ